MTGSAEATRVPCPACILVEDMLPAADCILCDGAGMVLPYVRTLYLQRRLGGSGEYRFSAKGSGDGI